MATSWSAPGPPPPRASASPCSTQAGSPSGTKLTSSRDRSGGFQLPAGSRGQVIAGWKEGIPGMKLGGKRRLLIPPELGYGPNGQPPKIPANATLTFDVEVVR